MSIAYQKDTGSPICVTDSYRSYAEQVVRQGGQGQVGRHPRYAASTAWVAPSTCAAGSTASAPLPTCG